MTPYPREVYFSWLASAGLAPSAAREWLQAAKNDPARLLEAVTQGETAPCGLNPGPRALAVLKKNSTQQKMDLWANLCEKYGISVCTEEEAVYPASLQDIPDAPPFLFYRGQMLQQGARTAGIVGSRSASWKGLAATEKIARELSDAGVSIISGLAYGIDAAAHKGCLAGKSSTVAVMGCGLEQDYPAENGPLKQKILAEGGLLLSEYAPGEKPLGWHFPVRNRIISGLSQCVILMEARIRSGSMTTVQHALDQGRDVFVYPGEADSLKSEGNHQLLREGAIYFTSAQDILEDMRWLDKKPEVGQNSDGTAETEHLTQVERAILSLLRRGAMSLDELCDATHMEAGPMMAQLTMMQISGRITALPGKQYGIKG